MHQEDHPISVSAEAEHSQTVFPPKPEEKPKQNSLLRSILSLAIFIVAFYFFFDWKIQHIFILAGVILIHEWGHFLAMKTFDYKELSIFFIPLVGAIASGSKDNISQRQKVIILLAGPVPGILIGMLLYTFGTELQNELMIRAGNIFLLINLFNLLPVIPLDGGQLIKTLFFESKEVINGIFMGASILLLGYFAIVSESFIFLIVPLFLLMQLYNQFQLKKVKKEIAHEGISLNQNYSDLSDTEYWQIRDLLGKHMKIYKSIIVPGDYTYSDKESRIMQQIKGLVNKKPVNDLGVTGKLLVTLFWLAAVILPLVFIVYQQLSQLS
jgi:Zn-dependent protease